MSTGSLLERGDGALAVLGEQHLVALAPQHDGQQFAHRSLVVDDEDARRAAFGGALPVRVRSCPSPPRAAGRCTATVVPRPGCELT